MKPDYFSRIARRSGHWRCHPMNQDRGWRCTLHAPCPFVNSRLLPACTLPSHCPLQLANCPSRKTVHGFGDFGCVQQKDSRETAWTEWRSGGPCLQLPEEGGLARQVKKAGVSTGAFWLWQHSCWLCSTIVGHYPLSKSLLQKMPSQKGLLLLAEVRAHSSALLLFLFFFFLLQSHLFFVFSRFECFPTHHV